MYDVENEPLLKNARVLVGTPNYTNTFSAEVHVNHSEAMVAWAKMGLSFNNVIVGRTFVHFARTQLTQIAEEGEFTHIYWLDDDATIEPDHLPRLIMHDKDIIITPYPMRRPPHEIGVLVSSTGNFREHESYRNLEIKDMDQGLIQVDGGGTHAMLVKTSVLYKIGPCDEGAQTDEWYSLKAENELGRPYFMMPKTGTEDMYFCYRAKIKGVEVWCDTDIFAGHVGFPPVVTRAYREAMEDVARSPAKAKNTIPVLHMREDGDNVRSRHGQVSTMRSAEVDRRKSASLV